MENFPEFVLLALSAVTGALIGNTWVTAVMNKRRADRAAARVRTLTRIEHYLSRVGISETEVVARNVLSILDCEKS